MPRIGRMSPEHKAIVARLVASREAEAIEDAALVDRRVAVTLTDGDADFPLVDVTKDGMRASQWLLALIVDGTDGRISEKERRTVARGLGIELADAK